MKSHEFLYGSTNIKIPESIFYVLVEDCYRFGFIKNGEANFSGFINDIIPKLSKIREEQHKELLKYNNYDLELTRKIEKSIFDVYLKEFNLEDDNTENLPFRINNAHRDEFIDIHDNILDLFNMDFTNYVRSLLKEYSIKSSLKRELCYFYNELDKIKKAIETNQVIRIYIENEVSEMIPIVLEQCYKKDKNYLVGISLDESNFYIITFDEIKRISYLNQCYILKDEIISVVAEKAYDIIYSEEKK